MRPAARRAGPTRVMFAEFLVRHKIEMALSPGDLRHQHPPRAAGRADHLRAAPAPQRDPHRPLGSPATSGARAARRFANPALPRIIPARAVLGRRLVVVATETAPWRQGRRTCPDICVSSGGRLPRKSRISHIVAARSHSTRTPRAQAFRCRVPWLGRCMRP